MGLASSFNKDISIKGDLNIYICGDINPITGKTEDIANYNILKKIFHIYVDKGKIVDQNYMNNIYEYRHRKC